MRLCGIVYARALVRLYTHTHAHGHTHTHTRNRGTYAISIAYMPYAYVHVYTHAYMHTHTHTNLIQPDDVGVKKGLEDAHLARHTLLRLRLGQLALLWQPKENASQV